MAIQEKYISAEDFLELAEQPEYQDRLLELVEGRPVEMSKPGRIHALTVTRLAVKIANHVDAMNLGEVPSGDAGFVLERNVDGRDTVRGLDVAYVSKSRVPDPPDFNLYELGPDLAVEVVSPSNRTSDTHLKVMQLMDAGTRLVWLVYPESRTVTTHTADGAKTLREDDTLSGGDVLPGFKLRVGDIFPT